MFRNYFPLINLYISEGSLVMWSTILVVNMISNIYLIMRVRKAIICSWFLLTSILFALRLFYMPYELHGTTYKTISIVINGNSSIYMDNI